MTDRYALIRKYDRQVEIIDQAYRDKLDELNEQMGALVRWHTKALDEAYREWQDAEHKAAEEATQVTA